MKIAPIGVAGLIFAVTHNYTGYPMVRQARAMVASGAIGTALADAVQSAQRFAIDHGYPIVYLNDSGGARIHDGIKALHGCGGIFNLNVKASFFIAQRVARHMIARGQGGSARLLRNIRKGHVRDFADYVNDFETVMQGMILFAMLGGELLVRYRVAMDWRRGGPVIEAACPGLSGLAPTTSWRAMMSALMERTATCMPEG